MKRTTKRFAVLTLVLVLLSFVNISLPYSTRAASRILSVPIYKQANTNWCWAASSLMVLNYYGIRLTTTTPQVGGQLHSSVRSLRSPWGSGTIPLIRRGISMM
jgi:hypothetical protein